MKIYKYIIKKYFLKTLLKDFIKRLYLKEFTSAFIRGFKKCPLKIVSINRDLKE